MPDDIKRGRGRPPKEQPAPAQDATAQQSTTQSAQQAPSAPAAPKVEAQVAEELDTTHTEDTSEAKESEAAEPPTSDPQEEMHKKILEHKLNVMDKLPLNAVGENAVIITDYIDGNTFMTLRNKLGNFTHTLVWDKAGWIKFKEAVARARA